jgi:hypothetical protein
MKRVFIAALFFTIIFSGEALALNVGVAPAVVNFGTIERGSRVSGTFYIVSDSLTSYVVGLNTVKAPDDFYDPSRPRNGYTFDSSKASEEDVSGWVTFLENSVSVPPEKTFVPGVNAWVNKKIDFILEVPANAEPGYHAGQIIPSPQVSSAGSGGVGVGIVTIVKATYIFKVPDEATRAADIVGFDFRRIDLNNEEITVLVKNTGTVTESVKLDGMEVYDGEEKTTLGGTGYVKIRPNGISEFRTLFNVSDRAIGSYRVKATVSWLTGKTEKTGVIDVLEYLPGPITGGVIAPIIGPMIIGIPLWVYPIFIMLAAILIYWWRYVRL